MSSMALITSEPFRVLRWEFEATLLAQEVAYKTNTDAAFATVRVLRIKNHLAKKHEHALCTTILPAAWASLGTFTFGGRASLMIRLTTALGRLRSSGLSAIIK